MRRIAAILAKGAIKARMSTAMLPAMIFMVFAPDATSDQIQRTPYGIPASTEITFRCDWDRSNSLSETETDEVAIAFRLLNRHAHELFGREISSINIFGQPVSDDAVAQINQHLNDIAEAHGTEPINRRTIVSLSCVDESGVEIAFHLSDIDSRWSAMEAFWVSGGNIIQTNSSSD